MAYKDRRLSGQWHGKFLGGGYRLTVPRRAILDALSAASEHPSAEEIYMKVHKKYPMIGLATVYRTLELLVRIGLIFRFEFGDGRARYELLHGSKSDHHHHLICTHCKKVINYTDFIQDEVELLRKTEKDLTDKYNFKIENHILQFHGLCANCKS